MKLLVLAAALAGCDLYVHDDPVHSTYCDSDGLHACNGDDCQWIAPTCDGTFACRADRDCAAGCYCASGGTCAEAGFCNADADCQPGFRCEVDRSSCVPIDATCAGVVTCAAAPPACAEHEVPLVADGCYTGACRAIAACDAVPGCARLQHEDDCLARTPACAAFYTGVDCTKPDGTACQAGDSGCTCASFVYASCQDKT